MQERIIIENFGGIQSANININEFNVFIGPQASGKSIVAKLLYYFKNIPTEISLAINKNIVGREDLNRLLIEEFKKYFPPHSFPVNSFLIRYETDNKFIEIDFKNLQLTINYSEMYLTAFLDVKNYIAERRGKDTKYNPMNYELIHEYIEKISTNSIEKNDQMFIPAGRSFFTNIKKDIFSFLTNRINIDPLLLEFGRDYDRVSNYLLSYENTNLKHNDLFEKNIAGVLKGRLIQENETEYLLHPDKRKVEMLFASSGQQEILPLIRILDFFMPRYSQNAFSEFDEGVSVYIEEPEAHIFPIAQKQIMELIVMVKNASSYNRQFIITTHSPYILTSLNNMMYAGYLNGKLKSDAEKKKLYKVLPIDLILNPDIVNVFSMENGKVESIINSDNHLISSDIIDNVSDDIAIEFDGLLNIEYEK